MSNETDPVGVRPVADGLMGLHGYDAHSFAERFTHDVPLESQDGAWSRVTPQSSGAFTTAVARAGWRGVDSTYLVCTGDRSTSSRLQRSRAAKATRSIDVPTGHHPFLSHPDLVVSAVGFILNAIER